MRYTKKNLRDVEDVAAKHGYSEHQEARFARADLEASDTGLAYLLIRPGRSEPFAHRHREAEEIILVLTGGGRIYLDDEQVQLTRLDAIRVPAGITRRLEAGEDGLEVVVFGVHVEGDAEIV
jgi:mannose-6-phosphate isomerase-like protein (cupin superfamily)